MNIHTEVFVPDNFEESQFMLSFFYDTEQELDPGNYRVVDIVLIIDNEEYGHLTPELLEILREEGIQLQRESIAAASRQCPECVV